MCDLFSFAHWRITSALQPIYTFSRHGFFCTFMDTFSLLCAQKFQNFLYFDDFAMLQFGLSKLTLLEITEGKN